jgi:hypothetical protein
MKSPVMQCAAQNAVDVVSCLGWLLLLHLVILDEVTILQEDAHKELEEAFSNA